jgi:hypothetical protein
MPVSLHPLFNAGSAEESSAVVIGFFGLRLYFGINSCRFEP